MALKGINAYKKGTLKQDIANADPHRLTLMLMQGALDKMAFAKGCIERKDYEHKSEHITKATAILVNLRDTLDMSAGGEVAQNLASLYEYMIERMMDANIKNDATIITEVIELYTPIKDAWLSIPESAKQEAYEMKKITISDGIMHQTKSLNHELTPFELVSINQDIEALLTSEETDTQQLSELVDRRHNTILDHMSRLDDDEKAFVNAEIPINDYLETFIGAMFKESSDTLFNLRTGRRAIKQYQQA